MSPTFRPRWLDETASTNDDAIKAAERGEPEGLVIAARRQTAGRGRHGRGWESPDGNLYCSLLLRPTESPTRALHSFIAALAVRDAVAEFLPKISVTLKWPNDVLADGKKIAGILLEAGEGWLVTGIGINVAHHPDTALYPATSMRALGASPEPRAVLAALLGAFSARLALFRREGFAPIRAAWLQHAACGRVSVRMPDRTVEGDFATLGEDGRLILKLADGAEQAIATGDVFFGME